jgi:hypothetical protein
MSNRPSDGLLTVNSVEQLHSPALTNWRAEGSNQSGEAFGLKGGLKTCMACSAASNLDHHHRGRKTDYNFDLSHGSKNEAIHVAYGRFARDASGAGASFGQVVCTSLSMFSATAEISASGKKPATYRSGRRR